MLPDILSKTSLSILYTVFKNEFFPLSSLEFIVSYIFRNLSYIFSSSSDIHFSFGCNLSGNIFFIFLYSLRCLLSKYILLLDIAFILFELFCLLFSKTSFTNELSYNIFKVSLSIKFFIYSNPIDKNSGFGCCIIFSIVFFDKFFILKIL